MYVHTYGFLVPCAKHSYSTHNGMCDTQQNIECSLGVQHIVQVPSLELTCLTLLTGFYRFEPSFFMFETRIFTYPLHA